MKIVVLDGHGANPGDLSWGKLATLGQLEVYPRTSPAELMTRAQGAEILLTNKVVLLAPEILKLPQLRYIGVLATGINVVDLKACQRQDIALTNIPGYSSASVCQLTFALLLGMAHQVEHHHLLVRNRSWSRSGDACLIDRPLMELAGQTLGLIGFGQIAREVTQVALAFGMQVIVETAHPEKYQQDWPQIAFVKRAHLLAESDIISLHCPLNEMTQYLVDATFIQQMKKGALLINTARGLLVDEVAVCTALHEGRLAGYAADVAGVEPPAADFPLLDAPNSLLTPHIAWGTTAARQRLIEVAVANLQSFMTGGRLNRLD